MDPQAQQRLQTARTEVVDGDVLDQASVQSLLESKRPGR